jgi:glutathione S-transferase
LIAANDGPFKHHLDRYKYPSRHGSDLAEHRAAGLDLLAALEARLAKQVNLCGEQRGLVDIALFPFVRQFAETDRAWFDAQPIPGVQGWLGQHLASPLFGEVMVRLEPWQAGDEPVPFPAGLPAR